MYELQFYPLTLESWKRYKICVVTVYRVLLCVVYCVLCTVYCVRTVPCMVYCVLCTVFVQVRVRYTVNCVLCTVYCVCNLFWTILKTVFVLLCDERKLDQLFQCREEVELSHAVENPQRSRPNQTNMVSRCLARQKCRESIIKGTKAGIFRA